MPLPVFDASSISTEGQNVNSRTFSHTVGSSDDRILLVGSVIEDDVETAVSGVTYDGQALSKIHDIFDSANNLRAELWSLLNPSSGVANVVISYAASIVRAFGMAVSYEDVYQSDPLDAPAEEVDTSSGSPSIAISPTVPNTLLVDLIGVGNVLSTLTVNGSQTQRINSGGTAFKFGMSEKAAPSPGANSMSWGVSPNSQAAMIAVALRSKPQAGNALFYSQL